MEQPSVEYRCAEIAIAVQKEDYQTVVALLDDFPGDHHNRHIATILACLLASSTDRSQAVSFVDGRLDNLTCSFRGSREALALAQITCAYAVGDETGMRKAVSTLQVSLSKIVVLLVTKLCEHSRSAQPAHPILAESLDQLRARRRAAAIKRIDTAIEAFLANDEGEVIELPPRLHVDPEMRDALRKRRWVLVDNQLRPEKEYLAELMQTRRRRVYDAIEAMVAAGEAYVEVARICPPSSLSCVRARCSRCYLKRARSASPCNGYHDMERRVSHFQPINRLFVRTTRTCASDCATHVTPDDP